MTLFLEQPLASLVTYLVLVSTWDCEGWSASSLTAHTYTTAGVTTVSHQPSTVNWLLQYCNTFFCLQTTVYRLRSTVYCYCLLFIVTVYYLLLLHSYQKQPCGPAELSLVAASTSLTYTREQFVMTKEIPFSIKVRAGLAGTWRKCVGNLRWRNPRKRRVWPFGGEGVEGREVELCVLRSSAYCVRWCNGTGGNVRWPGRRPEITRTIWILALWAPRLRNLTRTLQNDTPR